MNDALKNRFNALEMLVMELAERAEEKRKMIKRKADIAKAIVGLPYYWGEYSGKIKPHPTDETKVVVDVIHQKTEEETQWVLDAEYVFCHLLTIKEFDNWEDYYRAHLLEFAAGYEKLLIGIGLEQDCVCKEMKEVCRRFQIPYKSYLIEEAG